MLGWLGNCICIYMGKQPHSNSLTTPLRRYPDPRERKGGQGVGAYNTIRNFQHDAVGSHISVVILPYFFSIHVANVIVSVLEGRKAFCQSWNDWSYHLEGK